MKLYLRPLGFLYGATASEAVHARAAAWLAGGPIAFTGAELIEGKAGAAKRRVLGFDQLERTKESAFTALWARVTDARGAVAGLALDRPLIMGVVNVTPDSFSDGGLYNSSEAAIAHGAELIGEGADIIDIGGESTRPGADPLPLQRELERVLPVLQGLAGTKVKLSIDSRNAHVLRAAAEAGAVILNDVSALTHDPDSLAVARETGLPVVLMHAQGDPKTMQKDPRYDDVLLEVYDYLESRVDACLAAGIARKRLIVDPGIGFGKTLEHNLVLLSGLSMLHSLGAPVLLGASRKRFLGALLNEPDPMRREAGSLAAAIAGAAQGAHILRVHDVEPTHRALRVWQAAIEGATPGQALA